MVKSFFDLKELQDDIFSGLISRAYIYALVRNGKIRTVRIGKRILVPAAEVDRIVKEGI